MIVPINNGSFTTPVYIPTYTPTNFSSNDTTIENESRTYEYHEATLARKAMNMEAKNE